MKEWLKTEHTAVRAHMTFGLDTVANPVVANVEVLVQLRNCLSPGDGAGSIVLAED